MVEPAKKSTRPTLDPTEEDAVADKVALEPRAKVAPFDGANIATVGTLVATVTDTAEDVITAPLLSVTRAVSETAPAALGVQE